MPHIRVEITPINHDALKVKAIKEKKTIKQIITELITNYIK